MASTTEHVAVPLYIKKLDPRAIIPTKASGGSAGWDLYALQDGAVLARGKVLVSTGLAICVPHGTYGRIAPRSGLAWKHSIDVGAGVIDEDFRGPVSIILFNHSDLAFTYKAGERMAQLVIEVIIPDATIKEVEELPGADRGGGFGHSGK